MNENLINSLKVIPPFPGINQELINRYLLENNTVSSFHLKQKYIIILFVQFYQ